MNDDVQVLAKLLAKAPPFPTLLQDADGEEGDYYECPTCGGEGTIDGECVRHAVATAWIGGVLFYGCGDEFVAVEALYNGVRKHLPDVINYITKLERQNAKLQRKKPNASVSESVNKSKTS